MFNMLRYTYGRWISSNTDVYISRQSVILRMELLIFTTVAEVFGTSETLQQVAAGVAAGPADAVM